MFEYESTEVYTSSKKSGGFVALRRTECRPIASVHVKIPIKRFNSAVSFATEAETKPRIKPISFPGPFGLIYVCWNTLRFGNGLGMR